MASLEKPQVNPNSLYPHPSNVITTIAGSQVWWPNLNIDPIDERPKFWNGTEFMNGVSVDSGLAADPLRASFLPAETLNLIIDNLERIIRKMGPRIFPTSDNAYKEQLSWFYTYNIPGIENSPTSGEQFRPATQELTHHTMLDPRNLTRIIDADVQNIPAFFDNSFKTVVTRAWDGSARVSPTQNNYYDYIEETDPMENTARIPAESVGVFREPINDRWLKGSFGTRWESLHVPSYEYPLWERAINGPNGWQNDIRQYLPDPTRFIAYVNSNNIVTKKNLDAETFYRKREDDRIENKMYKAIYGENLYSPSGAKNNLEFTEHSTVGWPIRNHEVVVAQDAFQPNKDMSMSEYFRTWNNRLEDIKANRLAPFLDRRVEQITPTQHRVTFPTAVEPEPSWVVERIFENITQLREHIVPPDWDDRNIAGRYCWIITNESLDHGVYIIMPQENSSIKTTSADGLPVIRNGFGFVRQSEFRPHSYIEVQAVYRTLTNLQADLNRAKSLPATGSFFSVLNYLSNDGGVYRYARPPSGNAAVTFNNFDYVPFRHTRVPGNNSRLITAENLITNVNNTNWGVGFYLVAKVDTPEFVTNALNHLEVYEIYDIVGSASKDYRILPHPKFSTRNDLITHFGERALVTGGLYFVVEGSSNNTRGTYIIERSGGGKSDSLYYGDWSVTINNAIWRLNIREKPTLQIGTGGINDLLFMIDNQGMSIQVTEGPNLGLWFKVLLIGNDILRITEASSTFQHIVNREFASQQTVRRLFSFKDIKFEPMWRTAPVNQIATVGYVHQQLTKFGLDGVIAVDPVTTRFDDLTTTGQYYIVTSSDAPRGKNDTWFVDVKAFNGHILQKAESLTDPADVSRRVFRPKAEDGFPAGWGAWSYSHAKWFT